MEACSADEGRGVGAIVGAGGGRSCVAGSGCAESDAGLMGVGGAAVEVGGGRTCTAGPGCADSTRVGPGRLSCR